MICVCDGKSVMHACPGQSWAHIKIRFRHVIDVQIDVISVLSGKLAAGKPVERVDLDVQQADPISHQTQTDV